MLKSKRDSRGSPGLGGCGDPGRGFMRIHKEDLARDLPPRHGEGGRIETPAGDYRPPSAPRDLRCEVVVFTILMIVMMLSLLLGPSWSHAGLVLAGFRAISAHSWTILSVLGRLGAMLAPS